MQNRLLTFIHMSDTHIHTDPEFTGEFINFSSRRSIHELIDQINQLPMDIDFVLHTGDIMTDPEKAEDYEVAREILSQIKYPVYYLAGNHDNSAAIQQVLLGRTGSEITRNLDYILEIRDIQVICLDSTTHAEDSHNGRIEDEQLAWLDELCSAKDDRPLVVAIHHHTLPLEAPWLDRIVLANGVAVHNTLLKAKDRLRGVFYGHVHENTITTRDEINYYSVLSGWFQTRTWYDQQTPTNDSMHNPGFNVVTLTERDTFVRFYRFPLQR